MRQQPIAFRRLFFFVAVAIIVLLVSGGLATTVAALRILRPAVPPPMPVDAATGQLHGLLQSPIDTTGREQRRRAAQRTQLETYGWIDERGRIVRIPIDRAMELVVRDGL